jgi:LmbE family N-acetylglucosaminyl deacetylase
MRLMAVMAHPDDAEIWCGGTLMWHADRGDEVRICTLSYTKDSQRGLEGKESAREMGCQVEFLGMQDTAIRDSEEAVDLVWRCIESFQPDTIITHWHDDMHPDHEATFRLVRRALLQVFLSETPIDIQSISRIFCCDSMGSMGLHGPFKPDRYVDVTDSWDKKMAAIKIHQSQPVRLYLEMIDKQCRFHGRDSGKKRAEGFRYLPLFGITDTGPALGG